MKAVVVVVLLAVGSVRCDIRGSRLEAKADHQCAMMAEHGTTARNLARLQARGCRQNRDGTWQSGKVFTQ